MHADIKHWLDGESYGWYYKLLQVEKAVCVGWLMYSDLDTNQDLLAEEIFKMCGVKAGIRFRTISVKSSVKLKASQLVKALHVEVDERFLDRDKKRLQALYSAESAGPFPLKRKFRLVPQIQALTSPNSLAKADRSRIRQAAFLANVTRVTNVDIGVLDFFDFSLGGTLRDLIMSISKQDNPDKGLFVSVDKHFTGQGVMFCFTEDNHDEAKACINGMLPFLQSMLDPNLHVQIEKCFTPEAVLRSASCKWDAENRCVVSIEDAQLSALVENWDEVNIEFSFPDTDVSAYDIGKPEEKTSAKAKAAVKKKDTDSISMFASQPRTRSAPATAAVSAARSSTTITRSRQPQPIR